jgi:hypothetical protein
VLRRPLTLQPKDAKRPARGDPARGPVAWWKLDEGEGTAISDASGHDHAARLEGGPRWTPGQGRLSGALHFDGTKNFVDCGDAAAFDFREGVTVALWFKALDLKESVQTLAAKGNDTWRLYADGKKGELVFSLTGPETTGKDKGKAPRVTSTRAVGDGQWHHVAGVYDGQRVALYVDGTMEASVAASGPLALNTEPVWLGNNSAMRGRTYHGSMDDVRLYGCGLSEDEIKALNRGSTK